MKIKIDKDLKIRLLKAMREGFDKEMAQIKLNFEKEQTENATLLKKAIELEKQRQEELWKATNPEKAKAGVKFDGSSKEDLATARARVETAKKAVQEAKTKQENAPEPEARKSWDVLADSIHNAASALDSIGDSFSGTTQDAIKAAAVVLNTTVGIITQLII